MSERRRSNLYGARLGPEEALKLEALARETRRTKSDVLRLLIALAEPSRMIGITVAPAEQAAEVQRCA